MSSHTPATVIGDRATLESEWQDSRTRRWWWLPFPDPLEASFQSHYARRYRGHMALGLGVGVLAIVLTVFEDYMLPAAEQGIPLFIRLGMMLPVSILLFLLVYAGWWQRRQQSMLMMASLGGAMGFMLMGFYAPASHSGLYVGTVVLTEIFGLVLLRMQFSYAFASAVVIGSGSAVVLLWSPFPGGDLDNFVHLALIVFAGSLCLIGNFMMERSARSDYLQLRLLEVRQQDLEASNAQLQLLLRSDALTGIANRRYFDQCLLDEFRRAERGAYPLALLMVDVDCFKPFNDTYGHQAGDDTLSRVAGVLATFARRPGDVAARYGGEEFALILPGSREQDAKGIADELVSAVFAHGLPHGASHVCDRVTISVGVSAILPGQDGLDETRLIAQADKALYEAKMSGRNRAVSWSSLME